MVDTLHPNPDGTYALPDAVMIPLGNLQPGQGYRTQLRDMHELENSIRQFGVLTPLWVHPHPEAQNKYIIFAGRRRYEAAKKIARELCDPSLKDSIAAQVGRHLVPCRIFRDMARIKQALLTLTENVVRRDPSTVDTAHELKRIKALYEAEMGRPVKVDQILTMLCGTPADGKVPGRRHLYRLLRIGELDAEVAAAAKEPRLASEYLDQIARLPEKSDQLELIGLIGGTRLSRSEVREIVNKRLSGKELELSSIVGEVTSHNQPSLADATPSGPISSKSGNGRKKVQLAVGESSDSQDFKMEAITPNGDFVPDNTVRRGASLGPKNLSELAEHLRKQKDVDLLRAVDVLESWAVSEGQRLEDGGDTLKRWLADLAERGQESDEIERLRVAVEKEDYAKIEAELMKLFYTSQGVQPEHLPGYVRQIREAMAESGWYQQVVRCFLELHALLNEAEESKKVNATAKRLLDIVFNEFFWLATVYDPKLRYHVAKLPPLRKKEFTADGDLL